MENEESTKKYIKKSYDTIDVPHIPPKKELEIKKED